MSDSIKYLKQTGYGSVKTELEGPDLMQLDQPIEYLYNYFLTFLFDLSSVRFVSFLRFHTAKKI